MKLENKKRLYTGLSFLNKDSQKQFGSVEGWKDLPDGEKKIRIFLRKESFFIENVEQGLYLTTSSNNVKELLDKLRSVYEQITTLENLDIRNKLNESGYYDIPEG